VRRKIKRTAKILCRASKTHGKEAIAVRPIKDTRQKFKRTAKAAFPVVPSHPA
jgi:hypothetical protein